MALALTLVLFVVGLALVVAFAERLVEGVVGTSAGFGVSAFWISVVFIGFDPENLAVGVAGGFEGVAGIALGSVVGAAMVAVAFALGVTAMIVPLEFERVPRRILLVPVLAVALSWGLMLDGRLSRLDGGILLAAYAAAVVLLARLNRRGIDIKAGGEVEETLEKGPPPSRFRALGQLLLSLAAIVVGSEMLVHASKDLIVRLGWSDTVFGMTVLAFVVSVEELARELPAAMKKRPDITYGNVLGSVLAFFLFNAGIIACVRPVDVDAETLGFYVPVCAATVAATSIAMATRRVPRWFGAALVVTYVAFVTHGFVSAP